MSSVPNILMIAPQAPPKNSPESIQVRRMLQALDARARGRLVTVAPLPSGWAKYDPTLVLPLTHFDTQSLALPWHSLTGRLVMSHRLKMLHRPDAMFWLPLFAGRVMRALTIAPDILYSRSYPVSAALLARRLKRHLHIPWILHLSDPWSEYPYKIFDPRDDALEAACFAEADRIALTTEGQAEHYRRKYPAIASRIFVSPNVMPQEMPLALAAKPPGAPLELVFAGSLYGSRSPLPLVEALRQLQNSSPEILQSLGVTCYGNVQESQRALLAQAPQVLEYRGAVPFAQAQDAQAAADILLTIESDSADPMILHTLLSKVTDCLAMRRPMLAITPEGSETGRICAQGYGWAVPPSRPDLLAAQITRLIEQRDTLRSTPPKEPPVCYQASVVADALLDVMQQLISVRRI